MRCKQPGNDHGEVRTEFHVYGSFASAELVVVDDVVVEQRGQMHQLGRHGRRQCLPYGSTRGLAGKQHDNRSEPFPLRANAVAESRGGFVRHRLNQTQVLGERSIDSGPIPLEHEIEPALGSAAAGWPCHEGSFAFWKASIRSWMAGVTAAISANPRKNAWKAYRSRVRPLARR